MPSPVITLTSDFGWRDGYAAAMKAVILSLCPDAALVDITHDVPPQDISHAAFVLGTTCHYFPPGTIHVAVVDPGVGTERRPLLLITESGAYLAPDNGTLTYILLRHGASVEPSAPNGGGENAFLSPYPVRVPPGCTAYVLNRDQYWLKPVSNTFHGRDIFAPAAATLAAGISHEELGEAVDEVVCLYLLRTLVKGNVIEGRIIYIDRFGNLVSNIRQSDLPDTSVRVEVEGTAIHGVGRTYASGTGLLAIIGSHGYLEIAETQGSAAQHLGARVGTGVKVATEGRDTRP